MSVTQRTRAAVAAALLGAAMSLGACASDLGPYAYSRGEVGVPATAEPAVVLSSRPIRIEGTRSGVGPAAGAVIGGVAGAALADDNNYRGRGHHRGRHHYRRHRGGDPEDAIAVVAGALIGGLIGAAVEEGATQQPGVAYTVRMERTGEVITITQANAYPIPNGAPVWVEFGPRARILPRHGQPGYAPGPGPAAYAPPPPPGYGPATYSGY